MLADDVYRVNIEKDQEWEASFISWLEDKENNNIGVEDGVFVATVNPGLRNPQPEDEERFVQDCVENNLSIVTVQKLKKFTTQGIYHFGVEKASPGVYSHFKRKASELQSYKDDTCCTRTLNQENGLQKLFKHIESEVLHDIARKAQPARPQSTQSKVKLEEAALRLRATHEKYSKNIQEFTWDDSKLSPPRFCPDLECVVVTDCAESDSTDNEAYEDVQKRINEHKTRRQEVDDENVAGICYGYGVDCSEEKVKVTPNLTLSRIFNILWLIQYFYPGLHSSYLYFGDAHTFFPVHIEDVLTWSLNFLHLGHPKVWVIIPPWATDLLQLHLHKSGLHLVNCQCWNLLGHKVFLPTVRWLREHRIPFKIVVQRPGDLVVLYPNAAHFGFNLGFNIAQAVNIATKSWIPWGINAKKCTCGGCVKLWNFIRVALKNNHFFHVCICFSILFSICMFLGNKQIHLDIAPIVEAFRPDLLHHLLNGTVVPIQPLLRGLQLVHDEVSRTYVDEQPNSAFKTNLSRKRKGCHDREPASSSCSNKKETRGEHRQESSTFKCPATQCRVTFSETSVQKSKRSMTRHVHAAHKPILESSQLLQKISDLFKSCESGTHSNSATATTG